MIRTFSSQNVAINMSYLMAMELIKDSVSDKYYIQYEFLNSKIRTQEYIERTSNETISMYYKRALALFEEIVCQWQESNHKLLI
jgi:hypothetical protein